MMLRRPIPLRQHILRYLECLREPCHYLTLADVLQRPAEKVQLACCCLVQEGRLVRVEPGRYAITAHGVATRGVAWT